MKKGILFTCMICLVILTQVDAKIWRVNNIAGADADFTTLQAAHDGANAGDTLMIEPSPNTYGSMWATRKIIIVGTGYFLNENYPAYPTNNLSITDAMTFQNGSQGSLVMGIKFNGSLQVYVSNISIIRNYSVGVSLLSGISDVSFLGNYDLVTSDFSGMTVTNVVFKNNYMRSSYNLTWSSTAQILLSNNIFYSNGNFTFNGQTLINNIKISSGSITLTNCIYTNNIDATGGSAFGTSNGNQGGVVQSAVFVGLTGNTTDSQWKLRPGSPAIGAGMDGVDCGMFGGANPYVLSGVPPIPIITKLLNSGAGSNTTPLQITISAESKN